MAANPDPALTETPENSSNPPASAAPATSATCTCYSSEAGQKAIKELYEKFRNPSPDRKNSKDDKSTKCSKGEACKKRNCKICNKVEKSSEENCPCPSDEANNEGSGKELISRLVGQLGSTERSVLQLSQQVQRLADVVTKGSSPQLTASSQGDPNQPKMMCTKKEICKQKNCPLAATSNSTVYRDIPPANETQFAPPPNQTYTKPNVGGGCICDSQNNNQTSWDNSTWGSPAANSTSNGSGLAAGGEDLINLLVGQINKAEKNVAELSQEIQTMNQTLQNLTRPGGAAGGGRAGGGGGGGGAPNSFVNMGSESAMGNAPYRKIVKTREVTYETEESPRGGDINGSNQNQLDSCLCSPPETQNLAQTRCMQPAPSASPNLSSYFQQRSPQAAETTQLSRDFQLGRPVAQSSFVGELPSFMGQQSPPMASDYMSQSSCTCYDTPNGGSQRQDFSTTQDTSFFSPQQQSYDSTPELSPQPSYRPCPSVPMPFASNQQTPSYSPRRSSFQSQPSPETPTWRICPQQATGIRSTNTSDMVIPQYRSPQSTFNSPQYQSYSPGSPGAFQDIPSPVTPSQNFYSIPTGQQTPGTYGYESSNAQSIQEICPCGNDEMPSYQPFTSQDYPNRSPMTTQSYQEPQDRFDRTFDFSQSAPGRLDVQQDCCCDSDLSNPFDPGFSPAMDLSYPGLPQTPELSDRTYGGYPYGNQTMEDGWPSDISDSSGARSGTSTPYSTGSSPCACPPSNGPSQLYEESPSDTTAGPPQEISNIQSMSNIEECVGDDGDYYYFEETSYYDLPQNNQQCLG